MGLNSVADAIAAIAAGELVVVVDDDDRENEGDLIMAASKATPETGRLHDPPYERHHLRADRARTSAERLNLAPMVATNRDPMRTAFTVSVDYRVGLTTGISAEERTNTLRALANDNCIAGDFLRPGHVFPLISKTGGVLIRSGHTEAATDLARLAGLQEVGVLAEIVNDDGTVKRLPELIAFAARARPEDRLDRRPDRAPHPYRILRASGVESFAIATPIGEATAHIYTTPFDDTQHLAVVFGEVEGEARRALPHPPRAAAARPLPGPALAALARHRARAASGRRARRADLCARSEDHEPRRAPATAAAGGRRPARRARDGAASAGARSASARRFSATSA